MVATDYRLQTLSACGCTHKGQTKFVFSKSTPTPRVTNMKSWKKERYRRQKLFLSIKMRRRVSRDMANLSQMIIRDWQRSIKLLLKGTHNEPKSDKPATD